MRSRGEYGGPGAVAWWLAFIATAAVLAVPLFLTEVPPLLDYPNHLTRMGLFATGLADPVLSEFYTANWGIQPNMGLDLVVPPLARVMSLEWAGKVFVYFALVLPVLGACALHRALFLRRSYWPLASALVAYNGMFFAGFVNALVGAGIALLFWLIWRSQRGEFTSGYVAPIENFGLYWHFVDIVWLFLFPLLYLINRHPTH